MSTMGKITLQVGQPVTLTVQKATMVEGQFGPQVRFDSDEGALYLKDSTAAQQLGRLGLDVETVVGETITVEKVEKNGRTYTNIGRASKATSTTKPLTQLKGEHSYGGPLPWEVEQTGAEQAFVQTQQTPVPSSSDKFDGLAKLHARCLTAAVNNVVPALKSVNVTPTAEAIVAAAATLLIAAKDRGLAA